MAGDVETLLRGPSAFTVARQAMDEMEKHRVWPTALNFELWTYFVAAPDSALAREIAEYAQGVGPSKSLLKSAEEVATFHKAGLVIHPYTFRGSTSANSRRPLDEAQSGGPTVRSVIVADIKRYVGLGIDGGFTDYPELWKEAVGR